MPHTLDENSLLERLNEYLADLSRLAASEIDDHPVPEDASGLLAEVLERP